jgi:hypothetical protein
LIVINVDFLFSQGLELLVVGLFPDALIPVDVLSIGRFPVGSFLTSAADFAPELHEVRLSGKTRNHVRMTILEIREQAI